MSKRLLYAALSLVLALGFSHADAHAEKQRLLLGTSTVGGSYYILGGTWAKVLNDKLPQYDISVEAGGGPQTTIPLVQKKEMDLAYVTAWQGGEMFYGTPEKPKQYDNQRAFLPLYASFVYIYTLEDLPIKTIHDFNGHPVSTGSAGSSSFLAGRIITKILDIKPTKLSGMPTSQQLNTLRDGQMHAAFAVSGAPAPFMLELEASHKVRMIGLSDDDMGKLLKAQPYWSKGVIPAGTYKCNAQDVPVVALWNIAVAHKDLPDQLIYDLTKASFESLPQLATAVKTMADLKPSDILNSSVPLHPGAVKYYREQGIQIPDKLLPPEMK